MYPDDLKYTESHEWVRVENGLATVGITDFAQSELGDIVNVDLPSGETAVQQGNPFASLDSVKAVSDIMSPVTGSIVEVNEDLSGSPEAINEEPYGSGWMVIIRMDDASELDSLMSAGDYEQFVEPK